MPGFLLLWVFFLAPLDDFKKRAKRTEGAKTVILFSSRFRVFFELLIALRKKKVRALKVDFARNQPLFFNN